MLIEVQDMKVTLVDFMVGISIHQSSCEWKGKGYKGRNGVQGSRDKALITVSHILYQQHWHYTAATEGHPIVLEI